MTDPQPNSASASDEPGSLTATNAAAASAGSVPASESTTPAAPADLPEYEPLTPELVEDEAIRGDFMLRWAVVLLAFLLGCREITETMTLVRVRTGEYIAAHGFLPPATDVFSYTAADRRWVNQGWLFDLLLAGVNAVGGAKGLSVLTGLLAGATFYFLVHLSRKSLPTWWTAVCAAAALILAQLQFAALPELVTLLGVVWTLRGLLRWTETGSKSSLWCVAGSLAVWTNLDPRAFIGASLILLYLAGTVLSRKVLKRSPACAAANWKDLAKAAAIGLVALLVNPWGWHAWLAPVALYGTEAPAFLSYFARLDRPELALIPGVLDPRFKAGLAWQSLTGLMVIAVAVVSCGFNWKRLDCGLVLGLAGVLAFALGSGHELGAAVLVASVLAALNGQDWYRDNCRQQYSIATLEVLWSRLGRAVTVLSLVAVAWLAISGRMTGADGRRVGLGFSQRLQAAIAGSADDFQDEFDGRMFVFRPDHGDLLIWNRRPTFVDSRFGLYARGGENILTLHDQARYALQPKASSAGQSELHLSWTGRPELWKEIFNRFEVKLASPRLWGEFPDYLSYLNLLRQKDWALMKAGSTMAVFARTDLADDAPLKDYVAKKRTSFSEQAFRLCRKPKVTVERTDWPQPYSSYQNFLSLPETPGSMHTQRAHLELRTLMAGLDRAIPVSNGDAFGLAYLAIRDANAGLAENVRDVEAFRAIATAAGLLRTLEQNLLAQAGSQGQIINVLRLRRSAQRIHALRQGLVLRPDDIDLLVSLSDEYFGGGQWDLAHEIMQHILDVLAEVPEITEAQLALARRLTSVGENLRARLRSMNDNVDKAVQEKTPFLQLAVMLDEQGFPMKAVEILDEHKAELTGSVVGQVEYAMVLTQVGRFEEAESIFESLNSLPDNPMMSNLWRQQAHWLNIARGNYDSVVTRGLAAVRQSENDSAQAMLGVAPFAGPPPDIVAQGTLWPITQTLASTQVLYRFRDEATQLRWLIATAHLESGRCSDAATVLKDLLQRDEDTPIRPLVVVLYQLLTGEELSMTPPSDEMPALFEDEG